MIKLGQDFGRGGAGMGQKMGEATGALVDTALWSAFQLAQLVPGVVHLGYDSSLDSNANQPAGDLASALQLGNAMQASLVGHMTDVADLQSTPPKIGFHKASDAAHAGALQAIAQAGDPGSLVTLANGMKAAINAHMGDAGSHFHVDGTGAIATPDATDLGSAITLLNALLPFVKGHYGRIGAPLNVSR